MTKINKMNFYLQKAIAYDSLSSFFKYQNPNLFVFYYQKHLKYVNKAANVVIPEATSNNRNYSKKTYIRFLNSIPDKELKVRILMNGKEILSDAPFKTISQYHEIVDGLCHIKVIDSRSNHLLFDEMGIDVHSGSYHTIAFVNGLDGYKILSIPMQRSIPKDETKLRFVHLSPDSPTFDIAVKKGDVVFPEVKFEQTTEYLGLTPMRVELEARIAGSKNIVLSFPTLTLIPDQAYTLVALGFVKEQPLLEVILLED